jgi:predicted protein tyrosine phosphatase
MVIHRLFQKSNCDEIRFPQEPDEPKIILGALPNQHSSEWETLVRQRKIKAVLSVNEPWERRKISFSSPYTDGDWAERDVEYGKIDAKDHGLLTPEQMEEGARFIHAQIQAGRSVYVHCRAGCGRSSTVIAAYLMKYRGMTIEEACQTITASRKQATVWNKIPALAAYQKAYLKDRGALSRDVAEIALAHKLGNKSGVETLTEELIARHA